MPALSDRKTASQPQKKTSRPFGTLTIDTKSASEGRVFPYVSRIPELGIASYEDSKQRRAAHSRDVSLKNPLENNVPIRPGPGQVVPQPVTQEHLAVQNGHRQRTVRSLQGIITGPLLDSNTPILPSLHNRVKGLRPSPLDLSQAVSPSDHAITIGLALSPSSASAYSRSPYPSASSSRSPLAAPSQAANVGGQRYAYDVATPIIVVTPAKDRFAPVDLPRGASTFRPASSIYSRYTYCMPAHGDTPAVPPLPFLGALKSPCSSPTADPRESVLTTFEEDMPFPRAVSTTHARILTQRSVGVTAGIPTPRRSKGWWNVITSPFSAKSTGSYFRRSPPPSDESPDTIPILSSVAPQGLSDPHTGFTVTDRALDDEELRSAPVTGATHTALESVKLPKRSNTAPGALDANATDFDIYVIPVTGEAACYFNPNKHFPSLCAGPEHTGKAMENDLAGWSPSQSVYIPSRGSTIVGQQPQAPEQSDLSSNRGDAEERSSSSPHSKLVGEKADVTESVDTVTTRRSAVAPIIFSTPSEEELKSAGLPRPPPTRSFTHATSDSIWSPLSATPVVEDAHVARIAGPLSSFGEQRQVEVGNAPVPAQYDRQFPTLGAGTIAHSENGSRSIPVQTEMPPPRPPHVRQDSHGLGISDSEPDLYPEPLPLSEKPRLGTDRFGQLTIRSADGDQPARPWYRRLFWYLATLFAALLLLLVVLLAVFIPQRPQEMNVQASWLNLTGFPALIIGVSTVIQPHNADSVDTCVSPSDLWSCAEPGQTGAGLPNFRLEIKFHNGTLPGNETSRTNSTTVQMKRWQDSSPSHNLVKRNLWYNYMYSSSPPPPSVSDQDFLGQYTDNITAPYNGEETPFYISLLNSGALTEAPHDSIHKRSGNFSYPYPTSSNEPGSNASTTAAEAIPASAMQANGQPSIPQLYPLVTNQPLRLYNRGQESEHYGFYTYFDRSLYMSGISASANSSNTTTTTTANVNLPNTSAVCTFSQTRLRVQIWTRGNSVTALPTTLDPGDVVAGNSTANEMSAPGSFPYRVTFTLDRHGGRADAKGVYCYGVDPATHQILPDAKMWIAEDRAAGSSGGGGGGGGGGVGGLVHPADVPGSSTGNAKRDASAAVAGGIDGGSGGCSCQWQNWS